MALSGNYGTSLLERKVGLDRYDAVCYKNVDLKNEKFGCPRT